MHNEVANLTHIHSTMKTPQFLGDEEKHCFKESPFMSNKITTKKLAFIPLLFLIYFQVSGGPYGTEAIVGAGGPFYAILGFVIFPILWCVPEALITAELSTAFPGNGGFVTWTGQAFGPFWGFLIGFWKFLAAVINLSSYPLLCLNYIDPELQALSSNPPHYFVISVSTLFLSVFNFTGLPKVGYASVSLGILSYLPFIVISIFAIPKIDPTKWSLLSQKGRKKDWPLFFNTLFWNLNCWDNVSTLVVEGVGEPSKTLPKAFLSTGLITWFGYLIPLLASTGAMHLDLDDWVTGYYTEIGEKIVGKFFKRWVRIGAFLSGIGVFQSQLSSCSYQLLGMTELGLLPAFFGARSKRFDTPWVGILISTIVPIIVSYMKFRHVTSLVNVFYSLGMLFEFTAFIYLRMKFPDVDRPYKVPVTKLRGLIAMCLFPFGFLLYVVCVGHPVVYIAVVLLTLLGVLCYFCMRVFQAKIWLDLNYLLRKLEDYENLGYYDDIVK